MHVPSDGGGPNILELMGIVCDESWRQLQGRPVDEADEADMRRQMAQQVLTAVVEGERDPRRLMSVALNASMGELVI